MTASVAGTGRLARSRLPRTVHPGAWWLWALGMAVAASQTTDPLVLALILVVVATVVGHRRTDAPWARGFRAYLVIAAVVIAIRVVFRALLGGGFGEHVLLTLPELRLPEAAGSIRLGGPVTAEALLAAVYDGLRLAVMLVCLGAAQALANPKRLLRSVPGALYEVGSAVVVALSVAPQLVTSVTRVRRARRLRGAVGGGMRALGAILVPVLEDALDRSLALAAAMDSRGYGRTGDAPRRERLATGGLVVGGLLGLCVGLYGVLDATAPPSIGLPLFLAGTAVAAAGFVLGGRNVRRTIHRPDPWNGVEWAVVGSGLFAGAVLVVAATADPAVLHPSLDPLAWPRLAPVPAVGVLIGLLPTVAAPPPPVRVAAETAA